MPHEHEPDEQPDVAGHVARRLDALQQRREKVNAQMDREFKKQPGLSDAMKEEARRKAMSEAFTAEEQKRMKGISNGGYQTRRAIAAALACVMLLVATPGFAGPPKAIDPAAVKTKVEKLGVGEHVMVKRTDGPTLHGRIIAIDESEFEERFVLIRDRRIPETAVTDRVASPEIGRRDTRVIGAAGIARGDDARGR